MLMMLGLVGPGATCWAADAHDAGPCRATSQHEWQLLLKILGLVGLQHAGQLMLMLLGLAGLPGNMLLMSGTVGFVRERQVKHTKLPCQLNFQVLVSGSHSVMTSCFCALVSIPVSRKQRHVMSESSAVTPYGHVQSPLVNPPKPADLHCPTPLIFSQRLNKDP